MYREQSFKNEKKTMRNLIEKALRPAFTPGEIVCYYTDELIYVLVNDDDSLSNDKTVSELLKNNNLSVLDETNSSYKTKPTNCRKHNAILNYGY